MKEGQRGPLYPIIGLKVVRSTQSRCSSKALSPIAFVFIWAPAFIWGTCQRLDCAEDSRVSREFYVWPLGVLISAARPAWCFVLGNDRINIYTIELFLAHSYHFLPERINLTWVCFDFIYKPQLSKPFFSWRSFFHSCIDSFQWKTKVDNSQFSQMILFSSFRWIKLTMLIRCLW